MTVLVAHRWPLVAEGLAVALEEGLAGQDAMFTSSHAECIVLAAQRHPAVAVVDGSLVPGRSVDLCKEIGRHGVRVLVLTDPGRGDYLSLLAAGAQAIVLTEEGVQGVLGGVSAVLEGHAYVPPVLLGTVLRDLVLRHRAEQSAISPVDRLTPRERDVFALLGAGADHREIANRLLISPHTAKKHIHRLLIKLEVRSRIEAGALAVAHGVVAEEGVRHG